MQQRIWELSAECARLRGAKPPVAGDGDAGGSCSVRYFSSFESTDTFTPSCVAKFPLTAYGGGGYVAIPPTSLESLVMWQIMNKRHDNIIVKLHAYILTVVACLLLLEHHG
jgi:hypothetical protein